MNTGPNKINDEAEHTYGPYDAHGEKYIEAQKDFFENYPDESRDFLYGFVAKEGAGKVVADIGAGGGDDVIAYAQSGAEHIVGIDPSLKMLEIAKKETEGMNLPIELIQAKMHELPLPDKSVDIATARFSLHVISDLESAYREVARVLKSGGHFLFAVPHPEYDERVLKELGLEMGDRVKRVLFEGRYEVDNATHTMDEYLSPFVLENFEKVSEKKYELGHDQDGIETSGLLMHLKKKNEAG